MIYKSFSKKKVEFKFEDIDLSKNDPDQCYYYIGYRKQKGKTGFQTRKCYRWPGERGVIKNMKCLLILSLRALGGTPLAT